MTDIASFIASSLAHAVWSGRVWVDAPWVPPTKRELARNIQFAWNVDATLLVERKIIPILDKRTLCIIEKLATSGQKSGTVGEAVWELVLASFYKAEYKRLKKEALSKLRKKAKTLESRPDSQ